jgi:hypothetical protein
MDAELQKTLKEFLDAFEQVFDKDWNYTKEQLGIYDVEISISSDGTFLNPKIENETEDWGHRGKLLTEYRKLKYLLPFPENKEL